MQKKTTTKLLGAVLLAGAAQQGFGQAQVLQPTQAATLNYTVDAGLIYVDRLMPTPEGGAKTTVVAPATAAAPSTSRTLGLDRMRFVLDWETLRSASLHVVLRPDAVNRSDELGATDAPRDMDTRAGTDPYRPAPTIRLLDAYHLTLRPGASLAGSFGVFEGLALPPPAYPETLGFGLAVSLPSKLSGLRGRWRQTPSAGSGQLLVDLYVVQGDEDRAEAMGYKPGSRDGGAVARDPYVGGATHLAWALSGELALAFVGGSFDHADAGARRNELIAQLTVARKMSLGARQFTLGLDGRFAQERWRGASIKARAQRSVALTAAWHVTNATAVLLGAMEGRAEHAKDSVAGYGVEAGLWRSLGQGLSLQLILSHEARERQTPGAPTVGGFRDSDGDHGVARRMGLALSYLLNDNA